MCDIFFYGNTQNTYGVSENFLGNKKFMCTKEHEKGSYKNATLLYIFQ